MLFSEIPASGLLKERLTRGVLEDKIPQAQLFAGVPGTLGLPLAVAYAQLISCEKKSALGACGKCVSCLQCNKFIHPDIHFTFPFIASSKDDTCDPSLGEWRKAFLKNPFFTLQDWIKALNVENKQLNINTQECRSIHRKLSMKPFQGQVQIVIMWLPEYLKDAGNTLLKILEEPSPQALFILVTENKEAMLKTIVSRMLMVKVPLLEDRDLVQYLTQQYQMSEEKANYLAGIAGGDLSIALHAMTAEEPDQAFSFNEWLLRCQKGDTASIVKWVEEFSQKTGREATKFFLIDGLRQVQKMPVNGKENLQRCLEKAYFHLERNANPKILFLDVSLLVHSLLKNN